MKDKEGCIEEQRKDEEERGAKEDREIKVHICKGKGRVEKGRSAARSDELIMSRVGSMVRKGLVRAAQGPRAAPLDVAAGDCSLVAAHSCDLSKMASAASSVWYTTK